MPKHSKGPQSQHYYPKVLWVDIQDRDEREAIGRIWSYVGRYGAESVRLVTQSHNAGTKKYLKVVLKNGETAKMLAQNNPHNASRWEVNFLSHPPQASQHDQHVYRPGPSHSSAPRNQHAEAETESDRICAVLPLLRDLPSLSAQMSYVFDTLALTEEDHCIRQSFLRRLEDKCDKMLYGKTPFCFLYAFGSSVNGLGMKNCDLDLVLTTNGGIDTEWPGTLPNTRMLLNLAKNMLYSEQRNFGITGIVPIAAARIPVVKFKHIPTKVNCDLSFNRRLGVLNSRLIAHVMEFSKSARLLTFTVRLWGKQKGFVGGGGQKLNSYSITLMAIFFLQQVEVLPPLKMLKHAGNTIVDSREGESFYTNMADFKPFEGKMANYSQDELLRRFLEYYIRFPFETTIISVLHGQAIPVQEHRAFNAKLINVQDPYETGYNTAKGVQQLMKNWFRKCMHVAWCHRAVLCHPSHDGEPWGLQYLFQSADAASQSNSQRKGARLEQLVTLTVPYTEASSVDSYVEACTCVLRTLKDLYGMTLEVSSEDHPLSSALRAVMSLKRGAECQEGLPAKRSKSGTWTDDGVWTWTSSTPEEPIPSASSSSGNGRSETSHSASRHLTTNSIRPLISDGEIPSTSTHSLPPSSDKALTPTEFYTPYTVQAKTRCHRLMDQTLIQQRGTFNYDVYATRIGKLCLENSSKRDKEFTLTFQPRDAMFDRIDIELEDISTNYVQSIGAHLNRAMPIVLSRSMEKSYTER